MLQAAFIFIAPGADPKKDRNTVEEITGVKSVDLVANPATVDSLSN